MTQEYIGVKKVTAWPQDKDGEPGYAVKYKDGYISWSPKATFEDAYLPMGEGNDGTKITRAMVEDFIEDVEPCGRHGNHGVFLVRLRNGFTLIEESACVDPAGYDEAKAREICEEKAIRNVWHLLGFLLASAKNGLSRG